MTESFTELWNDEIVILKLSPNLGFICTTFQFSLIPERTQQTFLFFFFCFSLCITLPSRKKKLWDFSSSLLLNQFTFDKFCASLSSESGLRIAENFRPFKAERRNFTLPFTHIFSFLLTSLLLLLNCNLFLM